MKKKEYPLQLTRDDLFRCPLWVGDAPEFVKELNKASDPYILQAKKNLKNTQKTFFLFERAIF